MNHIGYSRPSQPSSQYRTNPAGGYHGQHDNIQNINKHSFHWTIFWGFPSSQWKSIRCSVCRNKTGQLGHLVDSKLSFKIIIVAAMWGLFNIWSKVKLENLSRFFQYLTKTISLQPLTGFQANGPSLEYNVQWRQKDMDEGWSSKTVSNVSQFVVSGTPIYVPYEAKVYALNDYGSGPDPEVVNGYSGEDCEWTACLTFHFSGVCVRVHTTAFDHCLWSFFNLLNILQTRVH